ETREAIDNVLENIQAAINQPVQYNLLPPAIQVEEVSVPIPSELESADKPMSFSNRIWAIVAGAGSGIYAAASSGINNALDFFVDADPTVQLALIVVF